MFGLAPQLVRLPAKRSTAETTAPLLTVPFMDEGPGIVPSIPTTVLPPELAERRLCTRKRFMVFPGFDDERVNIWLSSEQGPVTSAEMFVPKRARSFVLTS